jgi:transcriptional regulator with XRE-family HTH domain
MGYRIKEVREQRGMTQEALAAASGVGRVTIALIESGATKNASGTTLFKIATALGTTIDSLFFDDSVQKIEHQKQPDNGDQ